MTEAIHIYTDGSCYQAERAGGWAFVICGPDSRVSDAGREATSSSHRMELTAIVRALRAVQPGTVVIHTDHTGIAHRINVFADLIGRGKTPPVPRPLTDADLWADLASLMRTHAVTAVWVPSKVDLVNQHADRLARDEACQLRR